MSTLFESLDMGSIVTPAKNAAIALEPCKYCRRTAALQPTYWDSSARRHLPEAPR
jgi:hypothetical protein